MFLILDLSCQYLVWVCDDMPIGDESCTGGQSYDLSSVVFQCLTRLVMLILSVRLFQMPFSRCHRAGKRKYCRVFFMCSRCPTVLSRARRMVWLQPFHKFLRRKQMVASPKLCYWVSRDILSVKQPTTFLRESSGRIIVFYSASCSDIVFSMNRRYGHCLSDSSRVQSLSLESSFLKSE